MASKKGGGSTSNGRDSHSKRLGVKSYGGELISAESRFWPATERSVPRVPDGRFATPCPPWSTSALRHPNRQSLWTPCHDETGNQQQYCDR